MGSRQAQGLFGCQARTPAFAFGLGSISSRRFVGGFMLAAWAAAVVVVGQ